MELISRRREGLVESVKIRNQNLSRSRKKIILIALNTVYLAMIERFSLDCRKTKTKVNTLANQRA